jgi:hypothetical protein
MIWQDIVVQRSLSDHELLMGLAASFGVGLHEVLVCQSKDGFPEPKEDTKVVCISFERAKGFRMVLSLYTYFDPPRQIDPIALTRIFARTVQTECLLAEDSPNPYTMIRVRPTGEVVKAKLDVDRLDDEGEYEVVERE